MLTDALRFHHTVPRYQLPVWHSLSLCSNKTSSYIKIPIKKSPQKNVCDFIVKDIDSDSKLNFYKSIFLSISLLPKNFSTPPILLRSPSKNNKFFLQVKKLPTRYGWTVFTKHLFNYSTVNVTVYIKSSLCAIRSPHSSGLSDSLLHTKL